MPSSGTRAATAVSGEEAQRIAAALDEFKRRVLATPSDRAVLLGALAGAGGSGTDGGGSGDPLAQVGRLLLSATGQLAPAATTPEEPKAKRKKPAASASAPLLTGFEGLDEAEDEEFD